VKNGGPGETGLGTVIDVADHEITDMDFVNLDLSNLWAPGISSAQLTIESLQTGEGFKLCQGNLVGSMGTMNCTTGFEMGTTLNDTITISWGASNNMFGIQGFSSTGVSGPDALVQGITFDPPPVPEPASLLLFGSGIDALAVRKRSRNSKPITMA
jgi:PEP-CTERM motif